MVRDLLKRGEWMCKIDLKDAYLTTNIYEEDFKSSMGNRKTIVKNNRQTSFNNASYNSSKPTMQIPAVITNKIVGRRQILRNKNTTFKRGPKKNWEEDRSIKRSGYHIGHPRHGYNHRCIKQRLGAVCGIISTGGLWDLQELEYHINL